MIMSPDNIDTVADDVTTLPLFLERVACCCCGILCYSKDPMS